MPTVLVTGASAGLGRAVAKLFQARGWNVAATMRTPAKETELGALERVAVIALDVTDDASIAAAFDAAEDRFGPIDVVINNAGYGLTGAFETIDPAQIRRQFDTNVFGLMAVCRAAIPRFRGAGRGVIVNVASMGGRITFPLYSVYHATKWAVEGFSESLQHELRPFGVRVKLVEPGVIRTDFYGRSADTPEPGAPTPYDDYARRAMANMTPGPRSGSSPEEVAEVVWRAATDGRWKLRYVAGADARQILWLRKLTPDWLYTRVVRSVVEG
jgi:NAD(P)-dependent dehydrogenase (short-subunit alcohol dehydrogenase family)